MNIFKNIVKQLDGIVAILLILALLFLNLESTKLFFILITLTVIAAMITIFRRILH